MENSETVVTDELKAISVNDFQRYYKKWEQRLLRFVASLGNYFEGNKVDLQFKLLYLQTSSMAPEKNYRKHNT